MGGVIYLLLKKHDGWTMPKNYGYLGTFAALSTLAIPFIVNYIELDYSEAYLNKPENNYKVELDTLYAGASLNVPPKTLSKGKHVIAFMSLTCPHCRIAAKKIRIINERNPELSFYFVLNGEEKDLIDFYEDTHTQNIPHCILNGRGFIYLAGMRMPRIILVNNSTVEHEVNYFELNQDDLETWFGIE